MKQARQFGYLAKICLVIWRDFIWLFGDGLPHKLRLVSQVTYAAKRRASNALRTAGGTRWALSRWGNAWIHEFDAVIRNQATRQADICRGCPFAKSYPFFCYLRNLNKEKRQEEFRKRRIGIS